VSVRAVIAGNYREYLDWCREQGITPHDRGVFYATPLSLRGRGNLAVVRTGSWRGRDDLDEIERLLRIADLASA